MAEVVDHEAIRELLGAYVLDAVSADETSLVDAHIRGCEECRGEVDALRDVVGQLGGGEEAPPEDVWDRISERISTNPPSDLATLREARRPLRDRRLVRLSVAALVVVVAGLASLAYLAVHQTNQLDRANRQLVALSASPSIRRAADYAAAQPDSHQISLKSQAGTTRFEVVITSDDTAFVIPQGPGATLADNRTYQLWGVVDGNAISLGLLGAKPGVAKVQLPRGVQALAVTVEKGTGVIISHNEPVAQGSI